MIDRKYMIEFSELDSDNNMVTGFDSGRSDNVVSRSKNSVGNVK